VKSSDGIEAGTKADDAVPIAIAPPDDALREVSRLSSLLAEAESLGQERIIASHKVSFRAALGYQPRQAQGLDLVAKSGLALGDSELEALGRFGFVVSDSKRMPTFFAGYERIYAEHLPLYVSIDSILYALHRSYDQILSTVEQAWLAPALKELLEKARDRLAALPRDGAAADLDVYLAVALGLLEGNTERPVAGGDRAAIDRIVAAAQAHNGTGNLDLFGASRDEDYSQFAPRGHYLGNLDLERYFQSMIWLGRVDLRLIETLPDGHQVLRRRQLEAAAKLAVVLDEPLRAELSRMDAALEAFVGPVDSMKFDQLDGMLADLGGARAIAQSSDQELAAAILRRGYGVQRVASHLMTNGWKEGTLPLDRSFALMGQRYTIDAHVFSNLVYDRVAHGKSLRMMPSPLDAAFVALKNDRAFALLLPELERFRYAPDAEAMRKLFDDRTDWNSSLYDAWLFALRELSPRRDEVAAPAAHGLPTVAATEAWARRLLNTQLASWAELRHNTILYTKQSYSMGAMCEYPDAYVDPYPAVYRAIGAFAERGRQMADRLAGRSNPRDIALYFEHLGQVTAKLEAMAESERKKQPFTAEQMAFIQDTISVHRGCGGPASYSGWYPQLFFSPEAASEFDPIIADVHTQNTDEAGNRIGRVLHVATGSPRLFVTTVDTCHGPRAYVGLVSSYFEKTTDGFHRLNDKEWAGEFAPPPASSPADVPWVKDFVVRGGPPPDLRPKPPRRKPSLLDPLDSP
jgi:hypothetical protein